MLDSTHEENIMKTRKTITPIVNTKKLCVCQNIPLSDHRDSTKNHPEVGKVVWVESEVESNFISNSPSGSSYCLSVNLEKCKF